MLCFKDVAEIVAEALNSACCKIKTEDIMPNNSFNDLEFDYLAYEKLSLLINFHFNVKILPENFNKFKIIKNLYKHIVLYIDYYRILKKLKN